MDFKMIRESILQGTMNGLGFDELRELLATRANVEEHGPGRLEAGEARATFAIRQRTTARAGVLVEGMDELLLELSALQADEQVLLFSFTTTERLFTVMAHASSGRLLGCIALPKRQAR